MYGVIVPPRQRFKILLKQEPYTKEADPDDVRQMNISFMRSVRVFGGSIIPLFFSQPFQHPTLNFIQLLYNLCRISLLYYRPFDALLLFKIYSPLQMCCLVSS